MDATTTTTTKKKKKLIYKQDPDGVFRLKKIDDNDFKSVNNNSRSDYGNKNSFLSHDSHSQLTDQQTMLDTKKKVDHYLNELMDCSYQIVDNLNDHDQISTHKSIDTVPNTTKSTKKKIKPTPTNTSSKNLNLITPPTTSESVDHYSDIQRSNSISQDQQSQATIVPQKPTGFLKSIMTKTASFHPPSFIVGIVSGIISCITAIVYKNFFIKATIILIGLALISGVVGLIGLSICVYFNLFNIRNVNFITDLLKRFALDNETDYQDELSSLNSEENDKIPTIPKHQEIRDPRYSNQQPKLQKRRSSNIRVTPYRHERENAFSSKNSQHHESLPNLLNPVSNKQQQHQSQPNIPQFKRSSTEPVSKMRVVDKIQRNILKPKQKNSSIENSSKDLPILPSQAEELPFINEVKLLDSFDSEIENIIPMQQTKHFNDNDMIQRNMSKKSVLNTREKYKRFLANVDDDDD